MDVTVICAEDYDDRKLRKQFLGEHKILTWNIGETFVFIPPTYIIWVRISSLVDAGCIQINFYNPSI